MKQVFLKLLFVSGIKPVEQFYKDDRNEVLDESMLVYADAVKRLMAKNFK